MKKSYILVYSGNVGKREDIKSALNGMDSIEKWRYDLPSCFYLVSEQTAKEISTELYEKTDGNGMFIISEVPANSYGWLTPESWHLIQKKEYKPKAP